MNFLVIACTILGSCGQPYNSFFSAKPAKYAAKFQGKTFKVQSLPFDINGLHLQYQYIVKEDIYAEKPKEMVVVLDKKIVDLKRKAVVIDLSMQEDISPTVELTHIDKAKYGPEDFDDVNFDGYKDIREECKPCSGSLGNIETIYLFNPHTKKFTAWSEMDINIDIDKENKIVHSYNGPRYDGGEFRYKEIKFVGRGVELYEKSVVCTFLNKKKRTFKVVYNKYMRGKLVVHKTRIISVDENAETWSIIEDIKK